MRNSGMTAMRWAFPAGRWQPSDQEWMRAAQCVQEEEKARIGRFVFRRDAKSAMCGRLLIRHAIAQCLDIPYTHITLTRTDKGKPVLATRLPPESQGFTFNVSHQGDYVVLAADSRRDIGVDLMRIDERGGSGGTDGFFSTMRRQFTTAEWAVIAAAGGDRQQLAAFYRFWCLKESFVKALGVGIGFDLQRVSFEPRTLTITPGYVVRDTEVRVDGSHHAEWSFEEALLDDRHHVAVALRLTTSNGAEIEKASTDPSTRDHCRSSHAIPDQVSAKGCYQRDPPSLTTRTQVANSALPEASDVNKPCDEDDCADCDAVTKRSGETVQGSDNSVRGSKCMAPAGVGAIHLEPRSPGLSMLTSQCHDKDDGVTFRTLTFAELMTHAPPLTSPDYLYWTNFINKAEQPVSR